MLRKLFDLAYRMFLLVLDIINPPALAWGGADDEGAPETSTDGNNGSGDTEKTEDQAEKAPSDNVSFTSEQQAFVDSILSERLARAKKSWEAEVKALEEKANIEAEKQRLEDQQKFKELSEKLKAQVGELTPFKEKAEAYSDALTKLLEKERKGRPKGVLALLDRLEPHEQLEWLAENPADTAEKGVKPPTTNAGNRSNGTDAKSRESLVKQKYGIKY